MLSLSHRMLTSISGLDNRSKLIVEYKAVCDISFFISSALTSIFGCDNKSFTILIFFFLTAMCKSSLFFDFVFIKWVLYIHNFFNVREVFHSTSWSCVPECRTCFTEKINIGFWTVQQNFHIFNYIVFDGVMQNCLPMLYYWIRDISAFKNFINHTLSFFVYFI